MGKSEEEEAGREEEAHTSGLQEGRHEEGTVINFLFDVFKVLFLIALYKLGRWMGMEQGLIAALIITGWLEVDKN